MIRRLGQRSVKVLLVCVLALYSVIVVHISHGRHQHSGRHQRSGDNDERWRRQTEVRPLWPPIRASSVHGQEFRNIVTQGVSQGQQSVQGTGAPMFGVKELLAREVTTQKSSKHSRHLDGVEENQKLTLNSTNTDITKNQNISSVKTIQQKLQKINDNLPWTSFYQLSEDTWVYSAFHTSHKLSSRTSTHINIVAISKLVTTETVLCSVDPGSNKTWTVATRQEMSDNHGKLYGGVLFSCSLGGRKKWQGSSNKVFLTNLANLGNRSVTISQKLLPLNWNPIKRHFVKTGPLKQETPQSMTSKHLLSDSKPLQRQRFFTKGSKPVIQVHQKESELRPLTKIAVCVPPLYGNVKLSVFIQFIEMQKILGASHVFLYKSRQSSELQTVLDHYIQEGTVTQLPWQLPEPVTDHVWYHGQTVAVNDCRYRTAMAGYGYTVFVDLDEVITPHVHRNWQDMLLDLETNYRYSNDVENSTIAAFSFQSAYFEPDHSTQSITNHSRQHTEAARLSVMTFLRDTSRTKHLSSVRHKLVIKPDMVAHMGIHHVAEFVNTDLDLVTFNVSMEMALVHHYRPCTVTMETDMDCQPLVTDLTMQKYQTQLVDNFNLVVDKCFKLL